MSKCHVVGNHMSRQYRSLAHIVAVHSCSKNGFRHMRYTESINISKTGPFLASLPVSLKCAFRVYCDFVNGFKYACAYGTVSFSKALQD